MFEIWLTCGTIYPTKNNLFMFDGLFIIAKNSFPIGIQGCQTTHIYSLLIACVIPSLSYLSRVEHNVYILELW